ncbi:MAG: hypothetical protein FWH27_17310 [Planctomycetaceae bacterium]|nr:hypothetical protein [Planctomycetaceae bacterium]
MSTRSAIAIAREDGCVHAIYCHYDGYLSHVGQMLNMHYTDAAKVQRLMELGDISSLHERIEPHQNEKHSYREPAEGVVVAYHRDSGEPYSKPKEYISKDELLDKANEHFGARYIYAFEEGVWWYNGSDKPGWRRLDEVVKEATEKGDWDN